MDASASLGVRSDLAKSIPTRIGEHRRYGPNHNGRIELRPLTLDDANNRIVASRADPGKFTAPLAERQVNKGNHQCLFGKFTALRCGFTSPPTIRLTIGPGVVYNSSRRQASCVGGRSPARKVAGTLRVPSAGCRATSKFVRAAADAAGRTAHGVCLLLSSPPEGVRSAEPGGFAGSS